MPSARERLNAARAEDSYKATADAEALAEEAIALLERAHERSRLIHLSARSTHAIPPPEDCRVCCELEEERKFLEGDDAERT
jgi:hypothetical protein